MTNGDSYKYRMQQYLSYKWWPLEMSDQLQDSSGGLIHMIILEEFLHAMEGLLGMFWIPVVTLWNISTMRSIYNLGNNFILLWNKNFSCVIFGNM